MSMHLPDALLERFVHGDVGDHEAVAVALHLDDCPLCSARAATLEPLNNLFAHASDPDVPADLVQAILDGADASPVVHRPQEVTVGAALLGAAALLAVLFGNPVAWLTRAVVMFEATSSAAHAMQVALPTSVFAVALLVMAMATAAAMAATPFRVVN